MITIQEAIETMKEYQKQEKIGNRRMLGILCQMFYDGKLTLNELGALADGLGYELNEEFVMYYQNQTK